MNFFTQFFAFYEVVAIDNRLKHFHISLYMTILLFWNRNRTSEYVMLQRENTLIYCKIGSLHTYYGALQNLHEWGYIEYFPKPSREKYTKIRLIIFEFTDEDFQFLDSIADAFMLHADADMPQSDANMHSKVHQVDADMPQLDANMHQFDAFLHQTRCISASLYKVLKYINVKESYFKFKNVQNSISQKATKNPLENFSKNEEIEKRKKVAAKKENEFSLFPTQTETLHFFELNNSNAETAQKFFNHYSATGWVTKNNISIVDWQSAAKKWISNERSTQITKTGNYDEAF